jgi:hypothetical protein
MMKKKKTPDSCEIYRMRSMSDWVSWFCPNCNYEQTDIFYTEKGCINCGQVPVGGEREEGILEKPDY